MKIKLRFRRLILNVPEERGEVYSRVKAMLSKAETLADNKNVKIRLRAIEVVARLGMVLTGILKDVQLDEIERVLDGIEADAEVQRPQEEGGTSQTEAENSQS